MEKRPEDKTPAEKQAGPNFDKLMNEMGLDHLRLPTSDFQVNESFLKRLEDLQQGLFESPHLSPGFARELKYGFGGAFGHRLVDWVWQSLEPSFKSSVHSMSSPDLRMVLPFDQRAKFSELFAELTTRFLKRTGVHLPRVVFQDGQKPTLYYRTRKLQQYAPNLPTTVVKGSLHKHLTKYVWRFLTVDQVKRRLQGLFNDRPDLAAVFQEEKIGVVMIVRVLRELLKNGYPILEFDLIVETTLELFDEDSSRGLGQRVIEELRGVLFSSRFEEEKTSTKQESAPLSQAALEELARTDEFCIEIGRELLYLVEPREGGALLERVVSIRKSVSNSSGWVPPGIRFRDNLNLDLSEFKISIRGQEVARGEVRPGKFMALGPSSKLDLLDGIQGVDPTFGGPVVWIDEEERVPAEKHGCLIFTPVSVIGLAIAQALHSYAHLLFTHQALKTSLDDLGKEHEVLVDLVTDDQKLFLKTKSIVCRLLEEGVPISDKLTVLETVLEYPDLATWRLTELIRSRLAGLICRDLLPEHNKLWVIGLSKNLEESLLDALELSSANEPSLVLDHELTAALQREVVRRAAQLDEQGIPTVFLLHPDLRRPLRNLCAHLKLGMTFLTATEVCARAALVRAGKIEIVREPSRHPKKPARERPFKRARKWRKRS